MLKTELKPVCKMEFLKERPSLKKTLFYIKWSNLENGEPDLSNNGFSLYKLIISDILL